MDEELDPGHVANTTPSNPLPFVVALVGFLIVATLAFLFLRDDGSLQAFQPDEVTVIDDETVVVTGLFGPCKRIERAQIDSDDDTVFVELVAGDLGDCDCNDDCSEEAYELEIVLPEPVDDRRVVPGVGRRQLPCDPSGRCAAEQ